MFTFTRGMQVLRIGTLPLAFISKSRCLNLLPVLAIAGAAILDAILIKKVIDYIGKNIDKEKLKEFGDNVIKKVDEIVEKNISQTEQNI